MVKKLFLEDMYQCEFIAKVVAINGNNVELDQTCFYPEAGGQAGDTGTLNEFNVIDTQKDKRMGKRIIHILESTPQFKVGEEVKGKINWDKRYKTMLLHSASHIMEYFFFQVFGKQERLGSSVDHTKDRSDYVMDERLDPAKLKEVENRVNSFISENHEIKTWPDKSNPEFRFWQSGEIKESCGGTHPHNTSEIGKIRLKRKNTGAGRERVETYLME